MAIEHRADAYASPDLISRVTDGVLEELQEWQWMSVAGPDSPAGHDW